MSELEDPVTEHPPDAGRLADLGEDGLVGRVLAQYGPPPAWVRVPPGDDAAVLDLAGPTVVSTDTLVEGEDFRADWSDGVDVGVKVAAQNLADVAAMGARPRALLVSVAAPGATGTAWAVDLARGLALECARGGASVVGGDVSQAPVIVITGTAVGVLDGVAPVLRSGATPGDVVALAGVLGRSGAGLALLQAAAHAAEPGLASLLRDHRRPRPPYGAGPAAARAGARAMIDTSDGLLRDAGRIAAASGVVLDLSGEVLAARAADGDLRRAGELLGHDPLDWVLTGGEDHALLACFPPGAVLPEGFQAVGTVRSGGPAVLVDSASVTGDDGWHHFR